MSNLVDKRITSPGDDLISRLVIEQVGMDLPMSASIPLILIQKSTVQTWPPTERGFRQFGVPCLSRGKRCSDELYRHGQLLPLLSIATFETASNCGYTECRHSPSAPVAA